MVCAIAFALFILWKNLVSKIRKFLNQLNMNGGGKEGEGIRLPDKCTCWRVVSCEEKVGPEVGSPRFCKTAGSSDDSFEFCVVKISYGLYHLKQKIVDGSSCIQNEKILRDTKNFKISFSSNFQVRNFTVTLGCHSKIWTSSWARWSHSWSSKLPNVLLFHIWCMEGLGTSA